MLNNGKKKIMIYGRKQMHAESKKMFDYVACLYPEGNISDQYTFLFNHDEIAEVIFEGFRDEDEDKFLNDYLNKKDN